MPGAVAEGRLFALATLRRQARLHFQRGEVGPVNRARFGVSTGKGKTFFDEFFRSVGGCGRLVFISSANRREV